MKWLTGADQLADRSEQDGEDGCGLGTGPSTQGPKCFKEDKWCEVVARPGRAEPGKDSGF